MAVDDGDEFVVLKCIDHQQQADGNNPINIIIISTTDVSTWNFSSILQHPIIKVKAQTNRLIENSSYFHGLLGGNFRDPDVEVLVLWNRSTFLRLLASLFASPLVITSENFLSLFEGALYFGMEMILSHCKTWLTNALSDAAGVPLLQLTDLVSIWDFGSQLLDYLRELCTSYLAKNFIWAISCRSFVDVPYDLLLFTINHPHLTVDSEKQLCDHLLVWIAANKERCTEDAYITLLKQIRISLLPLWFAAGKSTYRFLSMCFNGSSCGALTLLKQPLTCLMDGHGDNELLNLKIRLTEFTQRVDLAGCSQITPAILLLSMLPSSLITEPALRNKIVQLLINHEPLSKNSFKSSCEMWSKLTFEAVHEMDISNCPMLHLENVVECFSKSFPSLRKFKAAYYLRFRTRKLLKLLVDKCPLICDIDLTVDVTPVVMTEMPSVASSVGSVRSPLPVLGSKPLSSNVTKLILEGRIDVTDFDLQSISEICFSLTYINLKGCILVSDAGISSLICRCLKLNSIVACDTYFGQQSILALCSLNARCDDVLAEHSMQSIPQGSNIQMLHMGGCKGINTTYFLNLMSHARMLKNLCLRDTEVVDDCLFNFCGSSLEVLDVSNTKVSTAALAHVIGHNPSLKCLKTRGCKNLLQLGSKNIFMDLGKLCKLDEISVGWGFSYLSLEPLKPAISLLKVIEVGLGGFLGLDGLPVTCPLLESVVLYFQVISDDVIVNMLESLQHLTSLALCHCLGEISSLSFKVSMPNLRKLKLERVAPWMSNGDMISLSQSCVNLIELSLLGCRLLNSEAQKIISSGWPGLISVHLEECGQVTLGGVDSLFDCQALEDVLLRHNGSGIQKGFIGEAVTKLPMLRKLSLDMCDAKDREFDIPELDDWCFLSYVKIARCKSLTVGASVHRETLVLMWDSKQMIRTLVKERI